jgi:Amt family ammonium transporter
MKEMQLGELAAVAAAVLWTLSTLAWTSSGRRIGALAVSFHRLMITCVFLAVYGGLVRAKNVVHTMILPIVCMAVVGVLWALVGYSLSFSSGTFDSILGGSHWFALRGVGADVQKDLAPTIPHTAFMLFQGMFAVITPALISGAVADRMKFSAWAVSYTHQLRIWRVAASVVRDTVKMKSV